MLVSHSEQKTGRGVVVQMVSMIWNGQLGLVVLWRGYQGFVSWMPRERRPLVILYAVFRVPLLCESKAMLRLNV